MPLTLKELIYCKNYSDEIKFELLRIVDSPIWLEDLFDLIKELSEEGCSGPENCADCKLDYECSYKSLREKYNSLKAEYELKDILLNRISELTQKLDELRGSFDKEINEYDYGDDLLPLIKAVNKYKNNIDEKQKEFENIIRQTITNIKNDLYGNDDNYNRFNALKEKISIFNELESLIPEYLLHQKTKIIEDIKNKKGLAVGGIELLYTD